MPLLQMIKIAVIVDRVIGLKSGVLKMLLYVMFHFILCIYIMSFNNHVLYVLNLTIHVRFNGNELMFSLDTPLYIYIFFVI